MRGFDLRRVVIIGFAAEEADGTPATAMPEPLAGMVAPWRRGSSESVFVEWVQVATRHPSFDAEAPAKARPGSERALDRLRRWLDAYESSVAGDA